MNRVRHITIFNFLTTLLTVAVVASGCASKTDALKTGLAKLMAPGDSSSSTLPYNPGNPPPGGSGIGSPGKVFNKNPLFAGAASGYRVSGANVTPATQINFDQYLTPVTIDGLTGGFLENPTLKVLTDSATSFPQGNPVFSQSTVKRAQADASGNWFFSSVGDNDHRLGQLMAYYWINKMSVDMEAKLAGGSYIKNKNTQVYSHCYDATTNGSPGLNAFWAGPAKYACMSYQGNFESSYDASVYVHEMGHGNIDYATNFNFSSSVPANEGRCPGFQGRCCTSADGCPSAINEGQADFHSQMIFNSGPVGEFFVNNRSGLGSRDSSANGNLTSAEMFARTNGNGLALGQEIHFMGAVWSAAFWTLRQNIGAMDCDKIFLFSLATLRASDTFRTALTKILSASVQLKNAGKIASDYANQITGAFSQHGISPQ